MKKRLISLAAFGAMTLSGFAQAESVYTLNGFGDDILDLFSAALDKGRKYPTPEEFEAAGYDLTEINFVRSHVRPRSIMVDHSKDVNQNVQEGRKLWMNVPIGMGKHQGGYPSTNFADDTFTGWNYTNVFGSWNHALFHVPAVATDCAHKNGSDIYSGIKFFESWTPGSGAAGWVGKVQTKDASRYGGYKYVEPLINALMFFGQDGINYNFEDSGYNQTDVKRFHQACYRLAAERGFDNFHIGIYTSIQAIAPATVEGIYGNKANGKTADAFLNYNDGDFHSSIAAKQSNAAQAINLAGSCDDIYQGTWIVTMARTWSLLNQTEDAKKIGIVLWGEHSQSRLFSYNQGYSPTNFEDNYQKLQERFFSGGNRNPATRPTATNSADWGDGLATFQGLAEYIPERTAIQQNLPFTTYFNIGSGERYNYKGNRTHGAWYNLGQQDVVPTYRWLVYGRGGTTPQTSGIPEFTTDDAYIGGSCLRLTNTQAIDLTLYRTKLTISGANPRVTVALKQPVTGTDVEHVNHPAQQADVYVRYYAGGKWYESKLDRVTSNDWEEQTVTLSSRVKQGAEIEYIGLGTTGNTQGLLVGMLSFNDDSKVQPAPVRDLVAEVKNPSNTKFSVKMRWDVDATATTRADYGLVYNDEAGIDHFEVFYKNGADGRVSEVARTTTWSAFVGNLELPTEGAAEPYIGVRAASVDGKTYSDIIWQALTDLNQEAAPTEYPTIAAAPVAADRYVKAMNTKGATTDIPTQQWASNPATNGYLLLDKTATVAQGQTVKLTLMLSDALKTTTGRAYADWDGDKKFNTKADEAIWDGKSGYNDQLGAYIFDVKVPADARLGEGRIRVAFNEPNAVTQPTEQLYTIKLAGTNYYFTTVTKQSTQNTTYTIQTTPETFRITKSGTGYTIQSAETDLWAGYNSTTSWDFYNKQSVWYINSLEGAETTILTSTKTQGFGCDNTTQSPLGAGSGVYTDKSSGYNKWIIEPLPVGPVDDHPGYEGTLRQGYAIDIPIVITGSEDAQREDPTAKDDKYLASYLDPESEGLDNAHQQRWFKKLTTSGADENISESWSSSPADGRNYVLVEHRMRVHQGQQNVQLQWEDARLDEGGFTNSKGDGFNYCTAHGYADWDLNGYFNATNDEEIWHSGKDNQKSKNSALTSPYTLTFSIPTDAVPGESRVRLVFSDAWFPHPGSSGMTQKGFTIDIPLEITGTNPARKPALDTHDLYDWLQPDGCWLWGDMNDDNAVTITDVTDVISLLLGRPSANIRRKNAADEGGKTPADAPSRVAGKVLERQ